MRARLRSLRSRASSFQTSEKIENSPENDIYRVVKFCLLLVFAASSLYAQTNLTLAQNSTASENAAVLQHVEELRAQCIQERRVICGKIVKILPEGIIV